MTNVTCFNATSKPEREKEWKNERKKKLIIRESIKYKKARYENERKIKNDKDEIKCQRPTDGLNNSNTLQRNNKLSYEETKKKMDLRWRMSWKQERRKKKNEEISRKFWEKN